MKNELQNQHGGLPQQQPALVARLAAEALTSEKMRQLKGGNGGENGLPLPNPDAPEFIVGDDILDF